MWVGVGEAEPGERAGKHFGAGERDHLSAVGFS